MTWNKLAYSEPRCHAVNMHASAIAALGNPVMTLSSSPLSSHFEILPAISLQSHDGYLHRKFQLRTVRIEISCYAKLVTAAESR